MEFILSNLTNILKSLGLAASGGIFWLFFWYYYSKKYTTPRNLLMRAGFLGVFAGILAALLEKGILSNFLSRDISFIFEGGRGLTSFQNIILIFSASLFLTALPEEIIKFLAFKFSFFKSEQFNQVIDGIKYGILIGIGFVLVENSYFFFIQLRGGVGQSDFLFLFLFRFFIATLAHSLYGAILGYYFGLARAYRIFSNIFLWQGFLAVTVFHGLFNFLAVSSFNIFTFILLVAILIVAMKWYTDRRNFQLAISEQLRAKTKRPLFSSKSEVQALLAEGTRSNFRLVEKLGLCPFCFKKLEPGRDRCLYCGQKLLGEAKEEQENFNKGPEK